MNWEQWLEANQMNIDFGESSIDLMRRAYIAGLSKAQQYDVLVKELFRLLDRTEESDSGATFKPVTIFCSREIDRLQLNSIMIELKNIMKKNIE
jgi:ubiquinone/menaquinone biosynthesis C-methylase UbiE